MEERSPRVPAALILPGAAVLMLWAVWHTLDPRLVLRSWDFGGHLFRARTFMTDVLGAGRLTGWFPYWHGGLPMTEVYPPLSAWVLGLASMIAEETGARVLLAAVWITAVPASFHFLKRFGVRPLPAALTACLVIALDAPRTFGIQSLFWLGLLPNGLGFVLAILALAEIKGFLTTTGVRGASRAGLLGGLTILAHPFCAYWLTFAALLLVAVESVGRADLRRRAGLSALAAVIALLIGAYQWFPFLLNRGNILVTDPFITETLTGTWKALASFRDAGGLVVAVLSLGGIAALSAVRYRREFIFFTGTGAVSFALSLGVNPLAGHLFGASQRARFEGFYLWIMLMPAAYALESLYRIAEARRRDVALFAVTLAVAGLSIHAANRARTNASAAPSLATLELAPLEAALAARFVPGDYLLSENDRSTVQTIGSPHFFNQRLALANPLYWDQGGGLPEGTRGSMPLFLMSRGFPDSVLPAQAELARHGVRFIATTRHESAERLDKVRWMKRVWPAAGMPASTLSLFEITPFENRFGLAAATSNNLASVAYSARGGYLLTFSTATRVSYPCELAMSFHPWLRASAAEKFLALGSTPDGRLELLSGPVEIDALKIAYEPPPSIGVVRLASLAILLAIFCLLLAPIFRRE